MAERRAPRGPVVAVTGGAGGIGAATAARLARAGARVAVGDLDGAAAARTAEGLPGAETSIGLPLDVTDPGSYRAFLDAVHDRLGPLDVLVANAGVMWVGPFEEEPETAMERQLAVNVGGVLRGLKLAVPAMRERGRGQVIVVASAASKLAPAGEATYAATKHAVLGYCTAVRAELRGSGVQVNVLMPTVVSTELATGTSSGLVPSLTADRVAARVLSLVRRPRPELFVPAVAKAAALVLDLLPARLRGPAHRLLVPDQVGSAHRAARASYERGASLEP
jgi:NAD(P)-dependent dehydrogenase (short-subunit alcohol dehydrogenase family)